MLLRLVFAVIVMVLATGGPSAQERQWSLDAGDQDAYLIFGVPDSDDVGVSLWCPVRQGAVNIFLPRVPEVAATVRLLTMTITAEDQSAEFAGKMEENLDAGVSSVEGQLPADHPIFKTLVKADRFHIKAGSVDEVFPLIEADLAGLVELCRTD